MNFKIDINSLITALIISGILWMVQTVYVIDKKISIIEMKIDGINTALQDLSERIENDTKNEK